MEFEQTTLSIPF